MGSIRNSANNTFRDYETDGLPSSGDHEPIKSEIRATFGTVEDEIETLRSGQTSGLLVYATWAELDAHPEAGVNTGASAKVFDDAGTHTDPVNATVGVANEGVYSFVESAGWERIANLEAEDARAWAEGTEPGGPGTRSAKEWAEDTTQSDLAERWASEAEDVEVEGGEFSSKHYAAKAAESAGALGGLAAVDALFATIPPKNKYNPALAEDGQIRNFSTGVKTANATSILSGKTPVTEGLTYTWSQRYPRTGFYPHIFAWNGATYLGALSSLPGSNVQFLQPTESGGVNNGHLQMTGTIPVGSNITHIETLLLYPYVAHDGATFDLIRNGVQLEIGDEVTDFEAYTTDSSRELSDEALPESALLARDAFTGVAHADRCLMTT